MRTLIIIFTILISVIPNICAFSIGDTGSSVTSRIIGGQVASVGQFPYQVSVQTKIKNYEPFVEAGGALISKDYVLTVGHAVDIPETLYIQVHLGVFELENLNDGRKIITVYEDGFIVHEDFYIDRVRYDRVHHDIALLKLPEPVEFTDKIQPIALPTRADANINMEGSYLLISGWGRYTDANRNGSQYLQYTELQVLNPTICKHYYDYLLPSMICTYTGLGKGTCQGDSGGPLVYTDAKTNRKFVVGLVSFGFYTCVEDGWPGVHTRVTSFLDWIATHTDILIL